MAEVNAGVVSGKFKIDTADLDRARAEVSKTGQAVKAAFGQPLKTGITQDSLASIRAADSAFNVLRSSGNSAMSAISAKAGESENALLRASTATEGLTGELKSMASGVGGAFGAIVGGLGIIAALKHEIDLGDKLSDLSDQTGLTIAVLGGVRPIAEQSGSSIETFARGVAIAQKNLGQLSAESPGLALGLKAIGLTVDELIRLSPDDFIERLAKGLGSIENQAQRTSLASQILGRSFFELGPVILNIAENGLPRLNEETAAAYRHLGSLKDQLDGVRAKLEDLAATGLVAIAKLFGLISLPAIEQLGKQATEVDKLTAAVARLANVPKARVEALSTEQIRAIQLPGNLPQSQHAIVDQLVAAREEQDKILKTVNATKAATAGNPLGLGNVDKLKNEMAGFIEGLQKQLTQIKVQTVGVQLGPDAGLKASLDAQFEAFTEGLRAKQIPVPRGLQDFFVALRDKIVDANKELTRTQFEMQKIDDLAKALSQDSAEWLTVSADLAKHAADALAKVETQFHDLQKTLAIEVLPSDQQGRARAVAEFEERVKLINEWRDAAVAAGTDVEDANQQAAQATTDAWVASRNKMKSEVDDVSEFTRRAFERGFDAVSDSLNDLLNNGFKNIGNLGDKLLQTMNKLVADAATAQLKDIFLGPDFGKKGGAIGGLIGDLFGLNKSKTPEPIQAVTAADRLDTEFGQQLRAAQSTTADTSAIAAIQAESTAATTAITAVQTEGPTALQLASTEGLTAIRTVGTTTEIGINAVKDVAIEAINALRITPGQSGGDGGNPFSSIPLIGNLFGGSQTGYGSAPPGVEGPALANGGFFSNPLGAAFSVISSFLPTFAAGGRMSALDTGIIGERGPEIWKPDTAGRVIPLSKVASEMGLGGGSTDNSINLMAGAIQIIADNPGSFHGSERQILDTIVLGLRRAQDR